MGYRGNLGCLWLALALLVVGGTPLLIGVLRVFFFFIALLVVGGAALSWWIRRQAVRAYTETHGPRHNRFVELLVGLLMRLAEIDGTLSRAEVTAVRTFFEQRLGYRDERLLWLRDLMKEARRSPFTVEEICAELAADYHLQERFIVIQVLSHVARADGVVSDDERVFIERVAGLLGLAVFTRSYSHPGAAGGAAPAAPDRIEEALSELGVERGTPPADIKGAWRKLSKEHHPDRVTHLGDEFRDLAEERMRRINAAYDTLKEAGLAE